jgi:hypothetical protein
MSKREMKRLVGLIFDFGSEAEQKCINNQAFREYRKVIVEQYTEVALALTPADGKTTDA